MLLPQHLDLVSICQLLYNSGDILLLALLDKVGYLRVDTCIKHVPVVCSEIASCGLELKLLIRHVVVEILSRDLLVLVAHLNLVRL